MTKKKRKMKPKWVKTVNDWSTPELCCHDSSVVHTYSDGVDGVGIAIVVAIVLLTSSVATGNDVDAAVTMATKLHAILHSFLQSTKEAKEKF
jgi:hypothetical protein